MVQLILDPYYRTYAGFLFLIDKQWSTLGFSWKRQELFFLFLCSIWELQQLLPTFFEFNQHLLVFLMDEAYAQRFSTFWCGDHRALSEAFTQQAVSVWQYLSSQENYQPFINDRFSAHSGTLPEVPINSSLWWSFLLRNNSSYLSFEKEVDAAFDRYRAAPSHPVFSIKKAAVVTLPDILDQLEQVKKLEIVETRIFSFPRSLEKLVNIIDLRLDNNCLSYVSIRHFLFW